jgi:hypothetical protein
MYEPDDQRHRTTQKTDNGNGCADENRDQWAAVLQTSSQQHNCKGRNPSSTQKDQPQSQQPAAWKNFSNLSAFTHPEPTLLEKIFLFLG